MQNRVSEKYEAIGWIRILLALMVVVSHINYFEQQLPPSLQIGEIAVLVFFVVSGYVISKIIVNVYSSNFLSFSINRVLRIYPMYWFCYTAGLCALALLELDTLGGAFTSDLGWPNERWLSYLAGYSLIPTFIVSDSLSPLSPAWSLVVELEFYFAAAVWWSLGSKLCFNEKTGKSILRRKTVWWGILGVAFVAAGFCSIILIENGSARFFGALKFGPFFLLGIFIFAIKKHSEERIISLLYRIGGAISFVGCVYWVLFSLGNQYSGIAIFQSRIWAALLFISLVTITYACIGLQVSPKLRKIDALVGDLTYPIYLSHLLILGLLTHFAIYNSTLWWIFCILVVIAVSYVLKITIEEPVGRLRTIIRRRQFSAN